MTWVHEHSVLRKSELAWCLHAFGPLTLKLSACNVTPVCLHLKGSFSYLSFMTKSDLMVPRVPFDLTLHGLHTFTWFSPSSSLAAAFADWLRTGFPGKERLLFLPLALAHSAASGHGPCSVNACRGTVLCAVCPGLTPHPHGRSSKTLASSSLARLPLPSPTSPACLLPH